MWRQVYALSNAKGVAMRLRELSVVAAVLSVVLVITGCTREAPLITEKHLDRWRAIAEEMVPLATEIEIEAHEVTTMGGNSNSVRFEMTFANFADLKSSNASVQELEASIEEQMARTSVGTDFVNAGAEVLEEEVASHLLDHVSDLERAHASALVGTYLPPEPPVLNVYSYLYVEDLEVIDPTWLDEVASHIHRVASEAGGQVYTINVHSVGLAESHLGYPMVEEAPILVQNLPAFADSDAASGCVRTDAWVYDVSNEWITVHPVDEPDGACA